MNYTQVNIYTSYLSLDGNDIVLRFPNTPPEGSYIRTGELFDKILDESRVVSNYNLINNVVYDVDEIIDVSGQQTIRFPLEGLISKTSVSNAMSANPARIGLTWSFDSMAQPPEFYYLKKDSGVTSYSKDTPFSEDKWITKGDRQRFSEIEDKIKIFNPKNLVYVGFSRSEIPALRNYRFPVETELPSSGIFEYSKINRYAFSVPEECFITYEKIHRVFIDPNNANKLVVSFNSIVDGHYEIKLKDIPDHKKTQEVIDSIDPEMLILVDINYRMTTSVDKRIKRLYPVKDDKPYFISGQNVPSASNNEKCDFIINSQVVPNTNDQQFQLRISYHSRLNGFQTFAPGRIKIVIDVDGQSSEYILKRTTKTPYNPYSDDEEYTSDDIIYDANSFNQAAYVLSLALNAPRFALLNSSRTAQAKKTYFRMHYEGSTYKQYRLLIETSPDVSPAVKSLRATVTQKGGSEYPDRIQYDLIVDRSKDPGFLGENNTFYLHVNSHEKNMNMIASPIVVKESGDLIWLRGVYNADEMDGWIAETLIADNKRQTQGVPLSISGSKLVESVEENGLVYDYVAPFDEEAAKINGQPFAIVDVSQVAITYDSRNRTGTMVVKTSRPITGPIRFGLSGIPRNKITGFVESDLSSDIVFNATGNDGTTFTMPLNASHFKIKASDLEKLVFANNQWAAHFKSNLTGNVQVDISTVHAEYEDDFLKNPRRSAASRRFSFTLNNSRTSTVSATGWNAKHSLYGNIVYAWVGNEQVKFFAIIGDVHDQMLLLPYEKAQELNLIPDLHLTVTVNSEGPGIRAAAKGTNGRFSYSFANIRRYGHTDRDWLDETSGGEEIFNYLVSAVNDTEKQRIRYAYQGVVQKPEGHPQEGAELILNAKVIRVNKTEFHFQLKKTFSIATAITTGKSLFEVPQEVFDKGLIEGFTLGDYTRIDNPITFKSGLLPSDIKRMVGFEVMSNINPAKVLFALYTHNNDNRYDRNTVENKELLTDLRELGQHRIVLKVTGGYTEERFTNITAVRKVNEGGVDKYYINISPKGVVATQPFNINLIESVNFTPNSDKTGGALKVTFKSSIEGHIQFALKDVPDDKKFDIVEKLLDPNVEYQTTASNARSIDIPVSKTSFKRIKPAGIVSIEYSENQWKLMVDSGNCGFLSATISDQSEMFEEDFLASSQANTESGRTVEFASLSGLGGANLITIPASASHNSNNTLYGNVVYIWLNGERKRFVALIKSNGDVEYIPKETGYARMFPVDCFDVMINSDKAVISHSGTQPESGVYLSGISTFNVQRLVTVVENYGVLRNQLDNFVANRNGNYVEFRYGGEMHRFNMHLEKVNKTQYRYKIQKNSAEFSNPNVVKGNSLFDIPQESMKKSLFKTITYGNGQPPVIEIDSQNISGSFNRYVRTKIYSKVNPNNVIMTIEAEPDTADRYISVNSTLTSGDTSELGDHRMTFELSDGYTEERRVNLSFIENAGLGRYKMTFAAVGQAPKTKKEILFEKVKSEIVGFRREYNSSTQVDDLQLIFKNEQHSSIYIRALNVNGLIGRHERIEGQWDASEWTDEINQLFTDGPYGPFVDIALSQNNTDDEPEDTIWVKFYRLPLTPHQYNLVPTGNESEYSKMLSFTCLRFDTSGNNEISLVVADTADTTTSYSVISPAAALPANGRLGDVKVLDTFFPIGTKNDTFSSINQTIQVSTTYVGGLITSSFSNKVPAALLSGKYTARGTNVAQLANRILSGMRVLFQLGPDYPKMLVYPVVNGNYIDFYPYKVGDGNVSPHPYADRVIDWLINRGLNKVPESTANGVSRSAFVPPATTGLPTNITIPGEESLDKFLSKIRERTLSYDEGTDPREVSNEYAKEVLRRVGLGDSGLYSMFEHAPGTVSYLAQWETVPIGDVLQGDLNNIIPGSNPDRATIKPNTITRDVQLKSLRSFINAQGNLANVYSNFANKLNAILTFLRNDEAGKVVTQPTGNPLFPPKTFPVGNAINKKGSDAFTHRIEPVTRPTKPALTSVKAVKQDYNDKADAYNRYLTALKDRYGYDFDPYKISDTDKFNLARPYVVDMPHTQYGNPEFDKPIDGATPGDLIGFIAEMVYGIQNDRTRNVLETIPGIYIPAVIPAEFRYLGRKDDVIKNQFIRVLNKWIELKPKNGLVREERDAFDALVDELIILSDNPITQSGLEDGSVYSLSTLFKGSLLNQDE